MLISFSAALALAQAQAATPQMSLTVYNGGFGLVKDVRNFKLSSGRQTLVVPNVASRIEPDSVAIRSISSPGSFAVLEQNYRYDLISPVNILRKSIGQDVIVRQVLPNGDVHDTFGTLLSAPSQEGSNLGAVIRLQNQDLMLNPEGTIIVRQMPKNLLSQPTLMWELESDLAGQNSVELSYITGGLSWESNYVLSLNDDGSRGDLKGWVTMINESGANYENCKLKFLAGDVNRVAPAPVPSRAGSAGAMFKAAEDSAMGEEQFGEYHLYTLPRPATVLMNEMKQLSLLEATNVPIQKVIIFDPMRNYRGWQPNEGEVGSGVLKPIVQYKITNKKDSNMGMPMPAGKFKIYQRDSEGATQLVGEDRIEHTPADETIKLNVGRAFDIVAERKRTDFKYVYGSSRSPIGATESFVTELRNRKKTAETVYLYERYWGDWKVTKASEPYKKLDANTISFEVVLKPGEVRKVTYSFETNWSKG